MSAPGPSIADQAEAAFAAYCAIVQRHRADPDHFDDPERDAERRAAHDRFIDLFEHLQ